MPNDCPSCGTEIKEGFKFCLSCGAQLKDTDTVDTQNFEEQVAPQNVQPQQPTTPPVPPGQTYGQTQTYVPMQPKKTNMKLIGGIIAIIVVIVVIALVVILFLGGGVDSRFVGSWKYEEPTTGMSMVYKFNGDGTLEFGMDSATTPVGNWRVSGDQLCLEAMGQEQCISYSLSSDGSQLTLIMEGQSMTFVKI